MSPHLHRPSLSFPAETKMLRKLAYTARAILNNKNFEGFIAISLDLKVILQLLVIQMILLRLRLGKMLSKTTELRGNRQKLIFSSDE